MLLGALRRVTIVTHELRGFAPVGGMGTATTFLALALARMGHSVDVLLGVMHRPESIDPYWDDVYRQAGIAIRSALPHTRRCACARPASPSTTRSSSSSVTGRGATRSTWRRTSRRRTCATCSLS